MRKNVAKIVLGALGFGLCKATISVAYITAMGSVSSTVGFVSELDFMFAMNLATFITATVIMACLWRGRLHPGTLSQLPAVAALLIGFFLSTTGTMANLSPFVVAVFFGILCGFALTILNIVWLEVFVAEPEATTSMLQMLGGLMIHCTLVSTLSYMASQVVGIVSIAALMLSAILLKRLKRGLAFPQENVLHVSGRSERSAMLRTYLCLFVLVGVVGILHTSVLGSRSEHIVGDVNMWVPLVAATLITVAVASLTVRRPNPAFIYEASLPAMLVVLSLLPFAGEVLGGLTGLVMIACYDLCGMVFLLFIVDRARVLGQSSYLLSAMYLAGSALFLVIGLSIGCVLGILSANYGFSLLTMLSFAAIYPLIIVFVLVLRRVRLPEDERDTAGAQKAANLSLSAGSADEAPAFSENNTSGTPHKKTRDVAGKDSQAFPERNATDTSFDTQEVSRAFVAADTVPPASDSMLDAGVEIMVGRFELTKREHEILGYLSRGRSAKYIAETFVISENTVWTHVKRIYSKIGVHSKQELMSMVEKIANESTKVPKS